MTRGDIDHLKWIHNRLEKVHGEFANFDYMIKLKEIIQQAEKDFDSKPINQSISEKDILMQEIQVLNETLYAVGECGDMKSAVLVCEKLMILVNKLVPSE